MPTAPTRWTHSPDVLSEWLGRIYTSVQEDSEVLRLTAIDALIQWREGRGHREIRTRVSVAGALLQTAIPKITSGVTLKLAQVPSHVPNVSVTLTALGASDEDPDKATPWPEEWNMPTYTASWSRAHLFPGATSDEGDEDEGEGGGEDEDDDEEDEEEEEEEEEDGLDDSDEEDGDAEEDADVDEWADSEDDDDGAPPFEPPARAPSAPRPTLLDNLMRGTVPPSVPTPAPAPGPGLRQSPTRARTAINPQPAPPASPQGPRPSVFANSRHDDESDAVTQLYMRWMDRHAESGEVAIIGIILLDERNRSARLERLLLERMLRAEDQLDAAQDKLIQTAEVQGARDAEVRAQAERARQASDARISEAYQQIAAIQNDAQAREFQLHLTAARREAQAERHRAGQIGNLFASAQKQLAKAEQDRAKAEQRAARRRGGSTEEILPDVLTMVADKFLSQAGGGDGGSSTARPTSKRKVAPARRGEEDPDDGDLDDDEDVDVEEEEEEAAPPRRSRRVARRADAEESSGSGLVDQAVSAMRQLGKMPASLRRALLKQVAKHEPGVLGEIAQDLNDFVEGDG